MQCKGRAREAIGSEMALALLIVHKSRKGSGVWLGGRRFQCFTSALLGSLSLSVVPSSTSPPPTHPPPAAVSLAFIVAGSPALRYRIHQSGVWPFGDISATRIMERDARGREWRKLISGQSVRRSIDAGDGKG
jgi:hypothetical protein